MPSLRGVFADDGRPCHTARDVCGISSGRELELPEAVFCAAAAMNPAALTRCGNADEMAPLAALTPATIRPEAKAVIPPLPTMKDTQRGVKKAMIERMMFWLRMNEVLPLRIASPVADITTNSRNGGKTGQIKTCANVLNQVLSDAPLPITPPTIINGPRTLSTAIITPVIVKTNWKHKTIQNHEILRTT